MTREAGAEIVARSRRKLVSRTGLVLLTCLALIAAACGGKSDDSATPDDGAAPATGPTTTLVPEDGGQIVYGVNGETNTWNAANGQWSQASWIVANSMFDTLTYWDEDFNIKPFLAESVEPNGSFDTWTIKLREGIEFHNGEPLNADAVIKNLDASTSSALLGPAMRAITSYEKVDDLTVQINLVGPWAQFPQGMASQAGVMMAPEMLDDPDGGQHPIGTGPFVFDEWTIDDHLSVTRNDDYWLGKPHLDSIDFKVIVDNDSRRNALEAGDLDAAQIVSTGDIIDFQADDSYTVDIAQKGEDLETFILLNQLEPPFDDIRAREAMVTAIDKQALIDNMFDGFFEPADGMYPVDSPWYVETDWPQYDPERARELVDEYEADTGEDFKVELGGPPTDTALQLRQAIAEQLDAVGIETEIVSQELTQYITSTVVGDYQANLWTYHSAPHPDSEYPFLHSGFAAPAGQLGLNFARNVDPEMDALLDQARGEANPTEQKALYDQIQQLWSDDIPYVWLWHLKQAIVSRDNVHSLTTWELPDGSVGAPIQSLRHRWHTAWVDQ